VGPEDDSGSVQGLNASATNVDIYDDIVEVEEKSKAEADNSSEVENDGAKAGSANITLAEMKAMNVREKSDLLFICMLVNTMFCVS